MSETTETVTPKVWIGCLASYNAGRLIGEWVEATDVDEMEECRGRVAEQAIAAAKEAGDWPVYFTEPEEFFLADHEGFPRGSIGEYTPFDQVAALGALLEEHGAALTAYLETLGSADWDLDTLAEQFEERSRGQWDSMEDYARDYVGQVGWAGLEPSQLKSIESYLDWEMIARELEMDSFITEDGYVFANY